jgi:probable modification methylase nmeDIP
MGHIKIFSFFAGAGFLDLGFEKARAYDVVFVNEFSPVFNKIYQYARKKMGLGKPRLGHHVCSIESLDTPSFSAIVDREKRLSIVGFIGGPPCPDFSVAGKNRGREGEHGKLSKTYVDLICKNQPDFFLFENVKGLYRTHKHRVFFDELCQQLIDNNYLLACNLVNAYEYGVAQDRDRLFLFGVRRELAEKLHKQYKYGLLSDFPWDLNKRSSREEVTSCQWPRCDEFKVYSTLEAPQGINRELTVQYWWDKNHVTTHPNQSMFFKPRTALSKFNSIKEGDVSQLSFKRLHRWRYSPTAAYGNNEVHLHPFEPRRISVAEALAIQSLPREFEIPIDIPLTAAFKTIGNGVPFLLALSLAKTIKQYLSYASKT